MTVGTCATEKIQMGGSSAPNWVVSLNKVDALKLH